MSQFTPRGSLEPTNPLIHADPYYFLDKSRLFFPTREHPSALRCSLVYYGYNPRSEFVDSLPIRHGGHSSLYNVYHGASPASQGSLDAVRDFLIEAIKYFPVTADLTYFRNYAPDITDITRLKFYVRRKWMWVVYVYGKPAGVFIFEPRYTKCLDNKHESAWYIEPIYCYVRAGFRNIGIGTTLRRAITEGSFSVAHNPCDYPAPDVNSPFTSGYCYW